MAPPQLPSAAWWCYRAMALAFATAVVFTPDFERRWVLPGDRWSAVEPNVWECRLTPEEASFPGLRYQEAGTTFVFCRDQLLLKRWPTAPWAHTATTWHELQEDRLRVSWPPVEAPLTVADDVVFETRGAYTPQRVGATVGFGLWMVVGCLWRPARMRADVAMVARLGAIELMIVAVLSALVLLVFSHPAALMCGHGELLRRVEASLPGGLIVLAMTIWLSGRPKGDLFRRDDRNWSKAVAQHSPLLATASLWLSSAIVLAVGAGPRQWPDLTHYASPFAGRVQWSDCAGYASGARHLLISGRLDEWNQRRPLNSTLHAVRLAIGGGTAPRAALMEHTGVGLALGYLVRVVSLRFGAPAALATWGWTWGMSRWFLAGPLSESLGLTLGCWGLALLLSASRAKNFPRQFVGLALMALGQAARPGALFVIPALCLWVAWPQRAIWRHSLTRLACAVLAAGAMLGVSLVLNRIYSYGENQPGANFAYTLLGLAEGRSWGDVMAAYRTELLALPNEGAVAQFLYSRAMQQIVHQPQIIVGEFARALALFAREFWGTLAQVTLPEAGRLYFVKIAFLVLAPLLCWSLVRRRSTDAHSLLLVMSVGVFASVPFVFLDGSWRVLIATWPVLAMGMGTALRTTARPVAAVSLGANETRWHACGLVAVLLLALVGPAGGGPLFRTQRGLAVSNAMSEIQELEPIPALSYEPITIGPPPAQFTVAEWQRSLQTCAFEECPEMLRLVRGDRWMLQQVFDAHSLRLWWCFRPGGTSLNVVERGTLRGRRPLEKWNFFLLDAADSTSPQALE